MTHPEMSAPTLALYLRRIRLTRSVPVLHAMAVEIERRFPNDEATPRLIGVIAIKAARLVEAQAQAPSALRCLSGSRDALCDDVAIELHL